MAMIESIAPSAAPPNALRMWTDGVRVYAEIPGAQGKAPYIVHHLFSEGGLYKLLTLLGQRRIDYDYSGDIPTDYRKEKPKALAESTADAMAEALLRRVGAIK